MLGINSNINSLVAQENLTTSGSALSQAITRLSSGKRINSAADDAAGLAISNIMQAQVNGLNQGVSNANDGVSMVQTASSGLSSLTSSLQTIRQLAVEASDGSMTDSDRQALQQEVSQQVSEINRIASQTTFNGMNVLDGSLGSVSFQVGANVGQNITMNLSQNMSAAAIGQGTAQAGNTLGSFSGLNLNTDGTADTAGTGATTGQAAVTGTASAAVTNSVTVMDTGSAVTATDTEGNTYTYDSGNSTWTGLASDGKTPVTITQATTTALNSGLASADAAKTVTVAGSTSFAGDVVTGTGTGTTATDTQGNSYTYTSGAWSGTGASGAFTPNADVISALNAATDTGTDVAIAGTSSAVAVVDANPNTVTVSDQQGTLSATDTAGNTYTYANGAWSGKSSDGTALALNTATTDALNTAQATATTNATNVVAATGTAAADAAITTINVISDGNGGFTLTDQNNEAIKATTAQAIFGSVAGFTVGSDSSGNATLSFSGSSSQVGSAISGALDAIEAGTTGYSANYQTANDAAGAQISQLSNPGSVADIDVSTQAGASAAMLSIDNALSTVNNLQATLGASQNRFTAIATTQQAQSTDLSSAQSNIQDADFAQETANLSKAQVLQQAGISVLAQANSQPQQILKLLQ